MHFPRFYLGSLNAANLSAIGNVPNGTVQYLHDNSLLSHAWTWVTGPASSFMAWLEQPHVLKLIMAWWITFTVVLLLLSTVGFNPIGIGAGTLAAAFQSWAYGGFTPAGGIFATLTAMGMIGTLMPVEAILSALLATIVTTFMWACGVGR